MAVQDMSEAEATILEPSENDRCKVRAVLSDDSVLHLGEKVDAETMLRGEGSIAAADNSELPDRDVYARAWHASLDYLSYRSRSEKEIRSFLIRKGFWGNTADAVIGRLQEIGLVDDRGFATDWVNSRMRSKPRGARLLRQELAAKGIDRDLAKEITEGIDEDSAAYQVGLKKAKALIGVDQATFQRRLGSFLLRRGFAYDIVDETVSKLWKEISETT
jgi:regulatory protein